MHICLVNPPLSSEALYGEWDLSGVDSISPPIGILILAAVVRRAGHKVSVVDAYAHGLSAHETAEQVMQYEPEVVGIGSTTPSILGAANLANIIKRQKPEIKTILGGAHISAVPNETFELFPQFDIGVIGEGENTLLELLDMLEKEKADLSNTDGIVFRKNGKVTKTNTRLAIADMDWLPLPAWDLLPSLLDPYRLSIVGTTSDKSTAILTSRGCPGRCSFCDTQVFGQNFRGYSARYVINMIDHLIKNYGIEDFLIYDDTFVVNKKRLSEICNTLIDGKYKIHWSCCSRVNFVNPEILQLMKKAGCWQIEYGIESGSPEILKRMKKSITLDQIKDALIWTKEAGIMTRGNFIFGYLGETKQTLRETMDFLMDIKLDYFQQTFLTPYPGSEVYRTAKDYGEANLEWEKMNNMSINFVPEGLTEKDLIDFSKMAFKKFYLRPKVIISHIKNLRSPGIIKHYIKAFLVFLKTLFR